MLVPGMVFDGVWKKFRRGERHDSLRDLIPSAIGRAFGRNRRIAADLATSEFWALRDVSFEVKAGEALGIIGPNGAGKSTILKLLTRILKPTRGRCEVRGRAGALIEVAAGFHPDLTGRENVYLQGAIMGMKRAAIAARFNDIIEFSGVGDFIDTQVKRYSSGMNARLGFAIAAHLDPDVLLIDEVLSVGDAAFQDRCVGRMRELKGRGIPLVFISHNLPAILDLCTRAIVVDHGTVTFDGGPAEAIQHYRMFPREVRGRPSGSDGPAIHITRAELLNDHREPSSVFQTGAGMRVRIRYEAVRPVKNLSFAVDIHRGDGIYCAGISTLMDRRDFGAPAGSGHIDLVVPHLPLLPGCYLTSIGIHDALTGVAIDLQINAYPFSVMSDRRDLGLVALDHEWSPVNEPSPLKYATAAEAV